MSTFTNSSVWQTIMTVIGLVLLGATKLLTSLGCVEALDGSLNCSANSAPVWLAPYLVTIAGALFVLKIIVSVMTGKAVAPTVPVSTSGAAGTVTPAQVASGSK